MKIMMVLVKVLEGIMLCLLDNDFDEQCVKDAQEDFVMMVKLMLLISLLLMILILVKLIPAWRLAGKNHPAAAQHS